MKKPITIKNLFENEITRSILTLLKEFHDKKGLRPMHIRYALEKEYATPEQIKKDPELDYNISKMNEFFGDRLKRLLKNNHIKKGCIKNREHLNYYLSVLGENGLKAIKKKGEYKKVRYRIKKEFYNEAKRRENIIALNFFPCNNIKSFPIKPNEPTTQRILYGLIDEIYDHLFDDADRKKVKANLDEIEKNIQEIFALKVKAFDKEIERGVQEFLDNTKSNTIKSLLKEDKFCDDLVDMFHMSMVCLKNTPGDISNSKNNFFNHFGILTENTERYFPSYYVRKEIFDFMQDYFFEGGKYTNKSPEFRIKKFCSIWSLCYFEKDYGFSLSDIRELIQWGWDNREFFEMFAPMSIAFSRYDEYAPNLLTKETVR